MPKINLTPIFEHVFGTSQITDRNQLNALIEVLRERGDKPMFDKVSLGEIAEAVQARLTKN